MFGFFAVYWIIFLIFIAVRGFVATSMQHATISATYGLAMEDPDSTAALLCSIGGTGDLKSSSCIGVSVRLGPSVPTLLSPLAKIQSEGLNLVMFLSVMRKEGSSLKKMMIHGEGRTWLAAKFVNNRKFYS